MSVQSAVSYGVFFAAHRSVFFAAPGEPTDEAPVFEAAEPVEHIAVNAGGSLIAVATSQGVEVWIVSRKIPAADAAPETTTTATDPDAPTVGALAWSAERIADHAWKDVRGLAWHPRARYAAGLVVLCPNYVLSTFYEPGLAPTVRERALLDGDGAGIDLAALTFGADDSPLGALSLYLGSTDGEVFGIVPFFAAETEVARDELELLEEAEDADLDGIAQFEGWSERLGENVTVLRLPTDGNTSAGTLVNTSNNHPSTTTPTSLASIAVAAEDRLEPWTVAPYPEALYEEEMLDLQAGSLGRGVDLLVQTTPRYVNLLVSDTTAERLDLVLSMRFRRAEVVRRVVLVSPRLIVVNTALASHRIHLDMQQPDGRRPLQHRVEAQDVALIYTSPGATSAVFVTLDEDPAGDGVFSAERVDLVAADATVPTQLLQKLELDADSTTAEPYTDTAAARDAQTLANQGASERLPLAQGRVAYDSASLRRLQALVDSYEQRVLAVYAAVNQAATEQPARVRDLEAQETAAQDLTQRLEKLRTPSVAAVKKRSAAQAARLAEIERRMEAQQRAGAQPPPTDAERAWFAELRSKLPAQVSALEQQVEALQARQEQLRDAELGSVTADLSESQLKTLRQQLSQQSEQIAQIREAIDAMS